MFSEIRAGVPHWVSVVPSPDTDAYLSALLTWRIRCGSGDGRNEGEASALAYAETHLDDDIALIDDGPARQVGQKYLGAHRASGSLWALAQGVREDPTRLTSTSRFCDTMLADGIRWPFGPGGFEAWARTNALI